MTCKQVDYKHFVQQKFSVEKNMGSPFFAFHSKETHAVPQMSKVFNLLSLHVEIQELKNSEGNKSM